MSDLKTTVDGIGAVAALAAGGLWFWASWIKVPDNIDTVIAALQRIGRINAWAAFWASVR